MIVILTCLLIIIISKQLSRSIFDRRKYAFHGVTTPLSRCVTMSSTMSCQNHINSITAGANEMLGLIRRNLRGTSQKLQQQAYISLVCPHLVKDQCNPLDIRKVEPIHQEGGNHTPGRWNPYTRKVEPIHQEGGTHTPGRR